MKCPKCGYNSFEYLDSCKKCNTDLVSFKVSHGIKPTILPALALALTPAANSGDQHPEFSPPSAPPLVQESDEFSWDSPEEQSSEAGAFPAIGLDLAPDEPDHFNFSLDLPEAAPEAENNNDEPFDGIDTEGKDFFLHSEPAEAVQMGKEEPTPQEETPFGELSFDELYGGEENTAAPAEPVADEPLPDFFGAADAPPAEEPLSDDAFGNLLEIERNADGSALIETSGAVDADPFQGEETIPEEPVTQEEDGDADLLGLSPEEYESLFGEAPKKKKPAPDLG